jgi:DNA-binding NarL/FixJ family response regulator
MSSTQLESRAGLYAPHRPMAQATPRIRVFVVHNHPVFRFGVVSVLEAEASVQCVGEAADLAEALHTAAVLAPDVVVLERVLSLIPPMTQLNTPYPSTAYLTGFLRGAGVQCTRCRKTWRWRWSCALSAPAGLAAAEAADGRPAAARAHGAGARLCRAL